MLIAVAAMASVSCQKEENAPVNETKSATLTLHATVADTKTYIEENTVLWGTGEYVQLYFNDGTNSQYVKSNDTYADEWNESDEAMFAFGIEYTKAESYVLGGVYPASAVTSNDSNTDPAAYKVDLPATQDATATSYDPAAFIMIMKPETVADSDFDKEGHIAYFRRAAALNKITLKGLKETITSITITVPEDKYLAGRRYFDLTTGVEGEIYHAKSNSITVNGTYNPGDVNVWFTSWGVELAAGEELTIKMTSATKTYTRTIEVREEGIKFVEGGLNTLIVNMSSVDGVVLDNLAGEYLIVNADLTCAAQAWAGGNNLPKYDLTVEDGVILESAGLENCKMTIELQSNGKYTIKDAKNYYLYAPSANSNHLKGLAEPSELTDWTIVKEGDKYVLTSSGNNSRNILRYNSTNTIFSCYGSGQGDVTLYKYSEIKPDTNPSITIEEGTEASIGAEGGNLTFTCTTKNLDGKTLEVDEESDYLTSSVAENVITITVAANETTESRTLNATIKCGSVEVPVTINQAGKPAAGATEWVSTSFADLKAGDEVVIVATKDTYSWAMANDNGTSKAPAAVSITYSGDKLASNPADHLVWYVGGDASGRIFYADAANGSKWLYCTNTNNGVRVGTNTAKTFVLDASSGYMKHEGTERFVGVYTTTPDWRCYTNTTGNTAGQTFKFFVKSGEGDVVTPDPTPDPDPTPEPEPDQPGGGESTVDFTFTSANSVTKDGVTVACNKGSGQSAPAWVRSQLRLYASNTIVVSSSTKNITKIKYVFTNQGDKTYASASGPATYTSGGSSTSSLNPVTDVWTGSSKSVTVTLGSSGQRVFKSVKVYTE